MTQRQVLVRYLASAAIGLLLLDPYPQATAPLTLDRVMLGALAAYPHGNRSVNAKLPEVCT